jgi:hypothetical protein
LLESGVAPDLVGGDIPARGLNGGAGAVALRDGARTLDAQIGQGALGQLRAGQRLAQILAHDRDLAEFQSCDGNGTRQGDPQHKHDDQHEDGRHRPQSMPSAFL